jgi:citrate lyase subunit beta/citryl-CoA lyase
VHPADVLFAGSVPPAALPVCDHYAGNEALIRKSLARQAAGARNGQALFDVTADCEDGAAVGREREHAAMVVDLACGEDNRFDRLGARIHDPSHPHWRTDLEMLVRGAGHRLAYLMVPKVERADDLAHVIGTLDAIAEGAGITRRIPVHALIESPRALAEAPAIAAMPRVQSLSFGLMDFVSAFDGAVPADAMASPGQFEHPLVRHAKIAISMACHREGKVASHNVCTDIANPATAGADASRALAEFAFLRMWSIHPTQIDPIVAALTPTPEQVREASEILFAAQAADWGPIRHAGRLQDRASYRFWWRLLSRARAAGAPLPDEAVRAFFS